MDYLFLLVFLFVHSLHALFIVTIASFHLDVAASASLGTTPSVQIITQTIKLQTLTEYKGEIDYEIIEAWIYSTANYFALNRLTDLSQYAHFSATCM